MSDQNEQPEAKPATPEAETQESAPDAAAGAPGRAKGPAVGRREVLFGLVGGVTGIAVGAGSAVAIDSASTPAPVVTGTGGVAADPSRITLGGSPILDTPFPDGVPLPPLRERVLALKDLLVQKGVVSNEAVEKFVEFYEVAVGPRYGAAVVAHAWVDPDFRNQLLNPPADKPFEATVVAGNYLRSQASHDKFLIPETPGTVIGPEGEWLRVVANGIDPNTGKRVHNLVSCTACSCYPQALLGAQPVWYKSRQYRARSVNAPRGVMREFAEAKGSDAVEKLEAYLAGVDEIRVWDSNSEARFLVLPEMPADAAGLSEEQLRELVTRNSMVGVEIL